MTNPEQREKIARIIDPVPFELWRSMYDYCIRMGDDDETARRYADDTHKPNCDKVLAKADAIIALHPAPPSTEVQSAEGGFHETGVSLKVDAAPESGDEGFANAVWESLKGDHNDLRKQAIILRAHRAALARSSGS